MRFKARCASGRGKSAEHQFARRSLLIRRMTTKPSSDQSKVIAPPSWAAILRCTNLLPKPSSFVGATTGGPPRSVHLTTTSSSWALHDTSKVPLESDSAPYFAELVANSCITKASAVLEVSPTFILGTETRIRTLAPSSSYGASRTEMRSPRSVASLFRPGTGRIRSCARPRAIRRLVSSWAISSFVAAERELI